MQYCFENDMTVTINPDFSISVINDEGRDYSIVGFSSFKSAEAFVFFADFDETDNSYCDVTGDNVDIKWIYIQPKA